MDLPLGLLELEVGGRRTGEANVVAEVEGDAAIAAAAGAGADPDHLAAGAEFVEPGRRVGTEPPGQDVLLPHLRRQGDPLQRHQRLAQAVGTGAGGAVGVDVLPARQEAGKALATGGLDFAAQVSEAGTAHAAQHVGITPLAFAAARTSHGQSGGGRSGARGIERGAERAGGNY